MPWRCSAHCGRTAVGGGWWTGSTTTVATVAAAKATGVTVAIPLPSLPIFAPYTTPTWDVVSGRVGDDGGDGDGGDSDVGGGGGGGSDPLLPLPPWASPTCLRLGGYQGRPRWDLACWGWPTLCTPPSTTRRRDCSRRQTWVGSLSRYIIPPRGSSLASGTSDGGITASS